MELCTSEVICLFFYETALSIFLGTFQIMLYQLISGFSWIILSWMVKIWHRSTLHHFCPPFPLLMTFFLSWLYFSFAWLYFLDIFLGGDMINCFFFCFLFNKSKKCQFIWHQLTLFKQLVLVQIKCQKQPPEVFLKKGVLKNFAKFRGKQLWQSLKAEHTPRKGNFKIYFSK